MRYITLALGGLLPRDYEHALGILYRALPAQGEYGFELMVFPECVEVALCFDVESLSDQPQNLMIDYVVHYVKANGSLAPKVWKLTKKTLKPQESMHITRKHSSAPVTTCQYYPGEHAVEPQINGQAFDRASSVLSER
jgi:hypothetical protein